MSETDAPAPTPPEQEPGFWPSYVEPASLVAAAIQYPIEDDGWSARVMSAYYRDSVRSRRLARAS